MEIKKTPPFTETFIPALLLTLACLDFPLLWPYCNNVVSHASVLGGRIIHYETHNAMLAAMYDRPWIKT